MDQKLAQQIEALLLNIDLEERRASARGEEFRGVSGQRFITGAINVGVNPVLAVLAIEFCRDEGLVREVACGDCGAAGCINSFLFLVEEGREIVGDIHRVLTRRTGKDFRDVNVISFRASSLKVLAALTEANPGNLVREQNPEQN